jgi:hypothetical protein
MHMGMERHAPAISHILYIIIGCLLFSYIIITTTYGTAPEHEPPGAA